MSTVEYNFELGGLPPSAPIVSSSANGKPASRPVALHRISEVRQEQGVSVRSAARRLGLSMQEVRLQEQASEDLRLSQLLRWQQILDVPLAELLNDAAGPLSTPVSERARMLRAMKTVKALAESTSEPPVQRLAAMLISQLVDLMPELEEVSAWHSVGQRRTQEEMGRIVERTIPDSFFGDANY